MNRLLVHVNVEVAELEDAVAVEGSRQVRQGDPVVPDENGEYEHLVPMPGVYSPYKK